jgi:hypothetical protein
MRLRLYCCIVGLAAIAVLSGCGTPGSPQLPSLQLAKPVDDLIAARKGNQVQLDWTLPRKNTDRTLIKNMPMARICRHEGTGLMGGCTEVAHVPTPKVPQVKGQTSQPVRMHYVDTLPSELERRVPDGFVRYAVEMLNIHTRSAGLSNQVLVPVAPTITAPKDLSAEVSADGVRIAWSGPAPPTPPTGLTYQYRLMRKPATAPAYISIADLTPSERGSYLDKTFEWDKKYDYRITTVTLVHSHGINAGVEGEDSKPVEVFTRDVYPPAQPAGLQAVFSSIGQKPFIDLTWAPNTESDLAGYSVFRRIEGGQPEKLNKQLVQVPSFRDENVTAGQKYIYTVSAVDLRGNESPQSAEATEKVPDKR